MFLEAFVNLGTVISLSLLQDNTYLVLRSSLFKLKITFSWDFGAVVMFLKTSLARKIFSTDAAFPTNFKFLIQEVGILIHFIRISNFSIVYISNPPASFVIIMSAWKMMNLTISFFSPQIMSLCGNRLNYSFISNNCTGFYSQLETNTGYSLADPEGGGGPGVGFFLKTFNAYLKAIFPIYDRNTIIISNKYKIQFIQF